MFLCMRRTPIAISSQLLDHLIFDPIQILYRVATDGLGHVLLVYSTWDPIPRTSTVLRGINTIAYECTVCQYLVQLIDN